MAYPLEIYKSKSRYHKQKKILEHLARQLIIKLENWKDFKPKRGLIEDFFKAAKGAFGLGKFHSYTTKSMSKNIYLTLLLTALVVQCGFKTKTHLQQLAEGKIELKPPITKKSNKNKKTNKNTTKTEAPKKTEQQKLEIRQKQRQYTLDQFKKI